ncbi:hypothetical protein SAMN04489841_3785 [Natrinema salaciae]|uniref:Uncharacterized protein n=1 Tax=Natrinema salaciae TaxID=1186196 RepID=A0A1H9NXQ2_9EURY|nr:hypothetical protein SAMN04489841_3785 [Natrinema salaciae]
MTNQEITVRIDPSPDADTDVFRIKTVDGIHRLLVDAHETKSTTPDIEEDVDKRPYLGRERRDR